MPELHLVQPEQAMPRPDHQGYWLQQALRPNLTDQEAEIYLARHEGLEKYHQTFTVNSEAKESERAMAAYNWYRLLGPQNDVSLAGHDMLRAAEAVQAGLAAGNLRHTSELIPQAIPHMYIEASRAQDLSTEERHEARETARSMLEATVAKKPDPHDLADKLTYASLESQVHNQLEGLAFDELLERLTSGELSEQAYEIAVLRRLEGEAQAIHTRLGDYRQYDQQLVVRRRTEDPSYEDLQLLYNEGLGGLFERFYTMAYRSFLCERERYAEVDGVQTATMRQDRIKDAINKNEADDKQPIPNFDISINLDDNEKYQVQLKKRYIPGETKTNYQRDIVRLYPPFLTQRKPNGTLAEPYNIQLEKFLQQATNAVGINLRYLRSQSGDGTARAIDLPPRLDTYIASLREHIMLPEAKNFAEYIEHRETIERVDLRESTPKATGRTALRGVS